MHDKERERVKSQVSSWNWYKNLVFFLNIFLTQPLGDYYQFQNLDPTDPISKGYNYSLSLEEQKNLSILKDFCLLLQLATPWIINLQMTPLFNTCNHFSAEYPRMIAGPRLEPWTNAMPQIKLNLAEAAQDSRAVMHGTDLEN